MLRPMERRPGGRLEAIRRLRSQQDRLEGRIQLGHAGRKGATKVAWEGIDQPVAEGGWPLLSASALPYLPNSQIPKAMDRADMDRVKADFVHATELAVETGADWLELHCAHGYLLSSFLSPLTNRRHDEYGGSHENRARYPLEVFEAIRAIWPDDKPISVRLSCHDWFEGATRRRRGNLCEDVQGCRSRPHRLLVWSGLEGRKADLWPPVSNAVLGQDPQRGRHSDIAVGAISEADHANSISRPVAPIFARSRAHTWRIQPDLHEAAKIGLKSVPWPKQYYSGKSQYETNLARAAADAAPAR